MIDKKRFREVEKLYENNGVVVYKARDMDTGLVVAYKSVTDPKYNELYGELLKKEYKLLSLFESERIVKPLDLIDDKHVALVTEFAEGQLLKALIAEGQLTLGEKINIAIDMVVALGEIHSQRILHKDINPTNLIWNARKKQIVLLDFNISERANSQKIEFVNPKHLQGTLPYISPEQTGRMNRVLDYRSDFYSLGITLYELFTGRVPCESHDYIELIHSHIAIDPKSPHEIDEAVPAVVSEIIMKLLRKNVEQRYQTIEGIKHDLELCKDIDAEVYGFVPGIGEESSRLNISQKVYGRKAVIQELLWGFQQAREGGFEHCFVHGYSGVGKTTAIQELYRPITEASGYFLSGKYDQYNISVPYSAILQVISDFANLLLAEGKKKLQLWRTKLLSEIGDAGAVLTQFVPELELVIGKQPEIPELKGMEAQNRFNHVLQKFLESIADETHPIVMFLDDLQWIDSASLNVVKHLFANKEIRYFYLIGAYRSNEVKQGHQLQVFFNNIESSGHGIRQVAINPLEKEHVRKLFNDTFQKVENLSDTVQQVMEKTKGNPFFIKQIINHFYEKKCIYYMREQKRWHIDKACFEEQQVADNVAEFLGMQMKEFEPEIVDVLKASACIGNKFDSNLVSQIINRPEEEVLELMTILLEENFFLALGADQYMFSHDQVQQAAYSLLDIVERTLMHYKAALGLIRTYGLECEDEVIFEIAGHFKVTLQHIEVDYDKMNIFKIYKRTGDIAVRNIAYSDGMAYYLAAETLVGEALWEKEYDLMLDLVNSIMETAYMLGAFDLLDEHAALAKKKVRNKLDLAAAYETEILSCLARQTHGKGLEITVSALIDFGMDISLDVGAEEHQAAFENLGKIMKGKRVEELISLKKMTDERLINVMRMLTAVLPLVFNAAPQILPLVVIKMIELSVVHGNNIYSPFAYAFFGTILCGNRGDIENGIKYGELSVELIDELGAVSEIPKTYMVAAQHVFHYRNHLKQVIKMEEEAFYKGIETGDLTYAGFAGHGYCFNYYLAGYELNKVQRVFETYTEALEKINQGTQNLFQHIYLQTIINLREKSEEQWVMSGEWFDEATMLPPIIERGHKTALFVFYFNKMQLAYIFNRYEEAWDAAELMRKNLDGGVGLMHVPIYYQFASLILLAQYDGMSEKQQEEALTTVRENQKYLENLIGGLNYRHRYLIVEAEVARVEGNHDLARTFYEEAIELVKSNQYINDEAVYREIAGRFYRDTENNEMKNYFMNTAYVCYRKWGASSKAKLLSLDLNSLEKPRFDRAVYTMHSFNTEFGVSQSVDLRSILKFSQAMAKEIVYDELLKKMLYILLENAGAERATILNYSKEGGIVLADNHIDGAFKMQTLESLNGNSQLPNKVINYVYNAKKIVRLDKATEAQLFGDDPYIKNSGIRSLLCFPLINQGEIVGIIYLENKLAEGVFSEERTEFLLLLSSQIAISLENAMVYRHLESLVQERTNDLEAKNKELQSLNMQLQTISATDGLTGLVNRRKLDDVLEHEFGKSQRYETAFAVILMDIDKFKIVNDTYGHHVGDEVLQKIAKVLQANTRQVDTVGRWGGEEFLIICPETGLSNGGILAEKLRAAVENTEFDGIGTRTGSFGVASLHPDDQLKELLKRADDNLYRAKKQGRNRVIAEV